jgi:hypothetical protein
MEAKPIPKVHLIRTNDFDKKDYDNLILFLENICIKERGKTKGKDLFIKYDNYVTIPKDEVIEKKLNLSSIEQLINSPYFANQFKEEKEKEALRKSAKSKIQKLTNWNSLFEITTNFRNKHKEIEQDDLIILLTNTGNNRDFFSGLDNKNIKNGFIHTDLWDFFLPGYNKIYPIAYEIIELIVHANMGCSYSEIEKLAHSKPAIGCITDMCNYKSEINIKIRTGDICESCLEKLKEHIIFDDVYFILRFLDAIRNETLRTYRYLNINKKFSNIKITKVRMKTVFEFTDYKKKLVLNGPLEKAMYLFLLTNKQGIPTPNEDFPIENFEPIIEIYMKEARIEKGEEKNARKLIMKQFKSQNGKKPNIYSIVSKINASVKKCVIGTQPEEEYKIHTILDSKTGFNTYKVLLKNSDLIYH